MEQPAFANVRRDPFIQQQNPVYFVPPLRIVAPPGVPPYLPHSFDPFDFFKGFRHDLFTHNFDGTSWIPPPPPPVPSHAGCSKGAKEPIIDTENGTQNVKFSSMNEKFDTGNAKFNTGCAGFGTETATSATSSAKFATNCEKIGPEHAERGPGRAYFDTGHAKSATGSAKLGMNSEKFNPERRPGSARTGPLGAEKDRVPTKGLEGADHCSQHPVNAEHVRNDACIEKMGALTDQKPVISKKSTENEHNSEVLPGHTQKKRKRESKPRKSPSARAKMAGVSSSISPHKAVINTLRLYDALRRNLLLEEESKDKDASKGSRPDLQAGSIINNKGLMVNRDNKCVGSVPGVEVGDQFYFRMELCSIGMHGPIQGGIEYLTVKESEYNTPIATSIISSGGYDALDNGEDLVYTGQGGKSALDGKSNEDQKLERGNLAMESSMKLQVPVRVTRGIRDSASPSGKTYTYDGLYKVEQCWSEKGKFGFEEFKFKLCRLPGQPDLGSATLKLSNSLKYKPSEREGLCLSDIASGKEGMPVCIVNVVDNLKSPPPFEYSTNSHYPQGATYEQFGSTQGCDCMGVCGASNACSCFAKNGNAFAYLNGGILVKERSVIYECGSNCKCSFSCRNRLTQKALKFRLEVFKTEDRGWGLRSWDTIPAGSFICEYTGRLIQNAQLLQTRDYVVDVGRLPKNNPLWGDVSSILDTQSSQATVNVSIPEFIVDSSQIGNASRFINHSCSPNVLVQCVMRDHQDTKRPHLMLFAMDNIPPFKELTRDYGSDMPRSNFEVLGKQCLCKSEDCRGNFYQ